MCGNVALISTNKSANSWQQRSNLFRHMLIADTIRGADGTGLCFVPWKDLSSPESLKQAVPAPTFLENKRINSVITSPEKYAVLMGHNRAATKGDISSKCSHPFTHKHITLCHNGTLTSAVGVDANFDVDSEAIAHAFAENGAKTTLEKIKGAYALQWYDAASLTYNIARNNERPLCFAFTPAGDYMFVASESWMIRELAMKNNIIIDKEGVWSLNPGYICTFYLGDEKKKDLKKYESTEFEIAKSTWTTYGSANGNFTKGGTNTSGTKGTAKTTIERYSEKRLELFNRKLEGVGLSVGSTIDLIYPSFSPYPHQPEQVTPQGKVEMLYEIEKNTYAEAVCYNVRREEVYNKVESKFTATVVAASGEDKNGKCFITVEDLKLKTGADDEEVVMYLGPYGEWVKEGKLRELVKDGCSVCRTAINIEEDGEWLDWAQGKPVCLECWTGGGSC